MEGRNSTSASGAYFWDNQARDDLVLDINPRDRGFCQNVEFQQSRVELGYTKLPQGRLPTNLYLSRKNRRMDSLWTASLIWEQSQELPCKRKNSIQRPKYSKWNKVQNSSSFREQISKKTVTIGYAEPEKAISNHSLSRRWSGNVLWP